MSNHQRTREELLKEFREKIDSYEKKREYGSANRARIELHKALRALEAKQAR